MDLRTIRRQGLSIPLTAVIAVVAVVVGLIIGDRAIAGGQGGTGGGSGKAAVAGTRIDVIVKATDSDFWQVMGAGSQAAGADLGIRLGVFGPTSETDVSGQVQLIENSISRNAKAIVIATNSSTALDSVIDRARKAGIKIIIVDNAVKTATEGFIGTDGVKAGQQAGARFCQLMKQKGKSSGKVLIESSVAGIEVLQTRDKGFEQGLKANCSSFTIAQHLYNNNDVNTGAGQVNTVLTRTPDLAGVFADNNVSGDSAAQAIADNHAEQKIPVVAFDSDPKEVSALASGAVDVIVVQNPYFFGYQGVVEAAMATRGRKPPVNLDPGVVLAEKSNMNQPTIKNLLNPPKAKL